MKRVLLVVDDDANMVELVSAICRQSLPEVRVISALNGTRGLELAQAEKPGVVVLDVKLPDLDGFEVCRRLRADPATIHTHILMITGIMMEATDRIHGIQSGADNYLLKPFDPEELVLQLQALFRWWEVEQTQFEKLETRVAERTQALAEANAGLQKEIAERKQAEEANQRLTAIINETADFVGMSDLEGRILFVNQGGRAMLDCSPTEDLTNLRLMEFLSEQTKEQFFKDQLPTMQAGKHWSGDIVMRTRDGREFPMALRGFPILDANGRPQFFAAIARDLSERLKAETDRHALVERTMQLKKEQSLVQLAGGIAHDFNNLLQTAMGNVELALEALPAQDGGRGYLEEVMRANKRMAELTRQMLVYAGGNPVLAQLVAVNRMVQDMKLRADAKLPDAITLTYTLAPDLPPVQGDEALLKLAVFNLVRNAGEALNANPGVITIRTSLATLTAADLAHANVGRDLPPGTYVTLEVSDTGCGLAAAVHDQLFDPFFSTKFMGRGLGLPVVAGIMRTHQGAIFVTSVPSRGATFRLAWPATTVVRTVSPPSTSPPVSRASGAAAILLVEDEVGVMKITAKVLSMAGYQVMTAFNGEEGVAVFRRNPAAVALVLMDLEMPKMGGAQAFREIRRIRPDVPVIISSGYGAQDISAQFGTEQPSGFLEKPYSRATLFAKLKTFMP